MKIICIGRNYAEHAAELGNQAPSEPMFFLKPDSAILPHRTPLYIPEWTHDLHYEVELVFRINRLGKYIEPRFANKYYNEVGIGIDFTARDIQQKCKEKGHPWEKAKAFDGSAAVSRHFLSLEELGKPVQELRFSLEKNGEIVQEGFAGDMIFSVDTLIGYVSQYMTFKIGDLLFTGTPSGVGPVTAGDTLVCKLEGKEMLKVNVK
ncbi:MAG: fumarylacetoacetate hydrolase family protein [Flavobacteriales bacterium]|nr:fumarylacetoacetate hydrolase family protein [Flavobacteriales bacterium]